MKVQDLHSLTKNDKTPGLKFPDENDSEDT